jgi:hypothetical protein
MPTTLKNFTKICVDKDKLSGKAGVCAYIAIIAEVMSVVFVLLMLAAMTFPPFVVFVAPVVFVAYTLNQKSTLKHARNIKEIVKKFTGFFSAKETGKLLQELSQFVLAKVSAIFEVQTPPPRQFRPV